jgi:hypothetical protein
MLVEHCATTGTASKADAACHAHSPCQMFTSEDAEAWWAAHREGVYAAYLSTVSAPQQRQQPSGDVQQQQPVNGGRPLVTLLNPHPLGPPLAELRLKR